MRLLKLGLISLIVFSLLLVMMSLLIPSQVRISRALNIHADKKKIRAVLLDRGSWAEWNELAAGDTLAGQPGGSLVLPEITILSGDSDEVAVQWRSAGKVMSGAFRLEESAGVTVVQWYFDFRLRWYPWEKFGSIVFDDQYGPPMERSLNALKQKVEKPM